LRDTLVDAFPEDIKAFELIPSSGGCFELSVDDKLIYSKLKTGEFPNPDDIVDALSTLRKASA